MTRSATFLPRAGKFANGAITAAFGYLFNRLAVNGDKAAYQQAIDYLQKDPIMSRIIYVLDRVEDTYTVEVGDFRDRFDPRSSTVYWDPSRALLTTDGFGISPALGLGHELGHAFQMFLYGPFTFSIFGLIPSGSYDNLEEYMVINGYENPAARTLGEAVRFDHRGTNFFVNNPLARGCPQLC
jgi:hypothetical protein